MKSFHKVLKNALLYLGLERGQFAAIRDDINEYNRKMLRVFSGITAVVFLVLSIIGLDGLEVYDNVHFYIIGVLISSLLFLFSWKRKLTRQDVYTHLASVWMFMFVLLSVFMAISPAAIDQRTTLYLVFPLIGPLFFCVPAWSFTIQCLLTEAFYLHVIITLQSQEEVFATNLFNSIVFTVVTIVTANVAMAIRARGLFHAYENQKTDEIIALNALLEEKQQILQEQYDIADALTMDYTNVYLLDITEGQMSIFENRHKEVKGVARLEPHKMYDYKAVMNSYVDARVLDADKCFAKGAFDLELVKEKLLLNPEYEFSFRTNYNNEVHTIQVRYVLVANVGNYFRAIMGFRNIDALVSAEERQKNVLKDALEHSARRERELSDRDSIIANAGYGIWYIILEDGKAPRMRATRKMYEILGIKDYGLTEEEVYDFWYSRIPEESLPSVTASVAEMLEGSFSENTYKWSHPDKGSVYTRCGGTLRTDKPNKKVLAGYHSDVTDIVTKEMEAQEILKQALMDAEMANKAKTSFLFNMSHDIRTPMNAILGFADLVEKHQEEADKRQDYIDKIKDSGEILLSILNNVLEMARIEKGTVVVEEQAWSVEQFNDALFSVFYEEMQKKGIDFVREVHVQQEYVFCDPVKLREVILNIISNAYKYTKSGGRVEMILEQLPYDREGWVLFRTTIRDTGIGMSEEFIPYIFDEFSREKNSEGNKIEGTGLGMPIVKRLVELMDGTIEVHSKKGVGSSFVVTIPHRIASREDVVDHTMGDVKEDKFVGKRILLAEDNDLNAEIAVEILEEVGFEVERAEDGAVCVEMLEKKPFGYYDVILMDIQMPHMNGYEATRTIRKLEDDKSRTPIIAMTANAFEEDKREAFDAGMNGHLAKPIVVRDLMRTLAEILDK